MQDIDRELVGFFRAAGSALDCLAATAIVVLRIPISIRRASAEALIGLRERAQGAEDAYRTCWEQTATPFEAAVTGEAQGWFEWTLEMRNAVIHRARQLRIWLPRLLPLRAAPTSGYWSKRALPRIGLCAMSDRAGSPWLADLDALSGTHAVTENWLPEPATQTVAGILERMLGLVEGVVGSLAETWEQTGSGRLELLSPGEAWRLGEAERPRPGCRRLPGIRPDLRGAAVGFNRHQPSRGQACWNRRGAAPGRPWP